MTSFKVDDLVQLRSEAQWNPSLFRIKSATAKQLVLGQLSDSSDGYVGLDTAVDLTDPESAADVIAAGPEILAQYPNIRR
ncbi:hypothetical protein [Mycolicibacterium aubagnense]|nr:hypothetical protein [Mycolicibacterium aubagnense]TLH48579.1 hypothetical protein C1S80_29815 [Mycolicibacterium aubagnense]